MGKVAAAMTVTTLITQFKITQLLFVGLAGATDPSLKIGDVVISEKLYQHDMDASPLFNRYEVPLTGKIFFEADASLMAIALRAVHAYTSRISSRIDPKLLKEFKISDPKCIKGVIASGDKFVGNVSDTQTIMQRMPETRAVEMEGAAVAQVCDEYGLPFLVIRIISDLANHSSHIDFPRFISEITSIYSSGVVKGILDEITHL